MNSKYRKEKAFTEGAMPKTFSFCSTYIEAIGYDAQRALLEVRLSGSGQVRRYANVPEEIWYRFRDSISPDIYYRRCICGYFPELTVKVSGIGKMKLDKAAEVSYTTNENDYQN